MKSKFCSASNIIDICNYFFLLLVNEKAYCLTLTLMLSYCSVMFAQGNGRDPGAPLFPLKKHLQLSQSFSPVQRPSHRYSNRSAISRLILERESSIRNAQTSAIVLDTAHVEWMTKYGSGLASGADVANAMAVDGAGNVFVTGSSTHLPYGGDITTIKYDNTGMQVWLQRYAGNAAGDNGGTGIVLTAAGEAYVAGYVLGTDGSPDWAVIKYSSSGSVIWKTHYAGASASADVPVAIKLDSHENLIVTGYGDAEFITIKYDGSGQQRWTRRYKSADGANGRPAALAIDRSDNIYVTGSVGIAYLFDYMTVKYDTDGNQMWSAHYDGPAKDEDEPAGVAVDMSGNVYVTGYVTTDLSRTFAFGTIKYDSNGVQRWVGLYSAGQHYDMANDIAIDNAGNVYVAGRSDSLRFSDGALLKYNPDGILLWKDRFDAGDYDEYMRVVTDAQNNAIVTGTSSVNSSYYDYITLMYSPSGVRQWNARYVASGYPQALCVDRFGSVFVTGASQGNGYDYATLKYNSSGGQQWVARYDGPGSTYEYPDKIIVDQQENTYVAGVSGDRSGGAVFTAKFSNLGVLQWAARYEGPLSRTWPVAIEVDGSGNVYVLATNWMNGGYDYVTLKYDALGAQLWAARYQHVQGGDNYAVALALDRYRNVIVTGATYEGGYGHYTTVKYSSEGKQIWVAQYPSTSSSNDTPQAMMVSSLGEIIVAGAMQGQFMTIKYSEDGREEWVARYQPPSRQVCWLQAMALDHLGNIIVTGACALGTTNSDCLTIKYNPLGKLVWAARYDGPMHRNDYGKSIVTDDEANVYVGGNSFGTFRNTLMLIKYSSVGTQLWVAQPGLPEGTDNWISSLDMDTSGYILLSATYSDALRTTTFSADGLGKRTTAFPISGPLAYDRSGNLHVAGVQWIGPQVMVVVGEYSASPLPPPDNSHSTPLTFAVSQNFPNPFNGSTVINFSLERTQKVDLRIYDLLGRLVTTLVSGELEKGDHYAVWNPNVPSGIYFYRLEAGDFVEKKKMILLK
jgi:hypothetical protein